MLGIEGNASKFKVSQLKQTLSDIIAHDHVLLSLGISSQMSVWEGVVVTPSDKAYEKEEDKDDEDEDGMESNEDL